MSAVAEGALASVVAGDPADPGVRRRAGAWLTRVFEPGDPALVQWVGVTGQVAAVRALLTGTAPARFAAQAAVRGEDRSLADLLTAARLGARLVVPGDEEWPARSLHGLVVAADRQGGAVERTSALVPPLGLWVRGAARLDELVDRSVAVVGSRASTAYGNHVAAELAADLWARGWTTVSGAATGIDAAAHRGRWPPGERRSRCWPAGSTGPTRRATRRCWSGWSRTAWWSASGHPGRRRWATGSWSATG